MTLFFLLPFILITNFLFAQPYPANDCKNHIDVKAEIQRLEPDSLSQERKHSGHYIKTCFQFQLVAKNPDYVIEKFKLSGENDDGDILEILNEASCFKTATLYLLRKCSKGKVINIFCIQAKDKNGKEYVLKPFSHVFL